MSFTGAYVLHKFHDSRDLICLVHCYLPSTWNTAWYIEGKWEYINTAYTSTAYLKPLPVTHVCTHTHTHSMCVSPWPWTQVLHYSSRHLTHSSVFFLSHIHQAGDPIWLEVGRGQRTGLPQDPKPSRMLALFTEHPILSLDSKSQGDYELCLGSLGRL